MASMTICDTCPNDPEQDPPLTPATWAVASKRLDGSNLKTLHKEDACDEHLAEVVAKHVGWLEGADRTGDLKADRIELTPFS